MIDKVFTGDEKKFIRCRNFLREEGFIVADAIHIGDNKFEFEEYDNGRLGCHNIYKILCYVDEESGQVEYKKKVIGGYCND